MQWLQLSGVAIATAIRGPVIAAIGVAVAAVPRFTFTAAYLLFAMAAAAAAIATTSPAHPPTVTAPTADPQSGPELLVRMQQRWSLSRHVWCHRCMLPQ